MPVPRVSVLERVDCISPLFYGVLAKVSPVTVDTMVNSCILNLLRLKQYKISQSDIHKFSKVSIALLQDRKPHDPISSDK